MQELISAHALDEKFHNLLENLFSEDQTATVEHSLLELASQGAVKAELPDIDGYLENYLSAKKIDDIPFQECALIELYLRLHSAGSGYSQSEKELLDRRQGIYCQPGGLFPLILAERFLKTESIVADLGAGNGLQGLLLQCITPHKKTMQIELSSSMIKMGQIFQRALGISDDCVEWINDDIANAPIESADFIYMYRPAKPLDEGNNLYRAIAHKLAAVRKPLIIFSVADCLEEFLDARFSVFYRNDYITCLVKQ